MRNRKFGVIKLIFLCLVIAVISAVPTLAVAKNKREQMEEILHVEPASFQGIINIWNVDTFESGSRGKSVFIEDVASEFSAKNRGVYFLVKNIGVDELIQSLLDGNKPDMICFGQGVGEVVKPLLKELNMVENCDVRQEVLSAGKVGESQLAVGFLMGGYILASTQEKLLDAGVDADVQLSSILNSCGFDTQTKNGVKHTSSIVIGTNNFTLPQMSLKNATGVEVKDIYWSVSPYDAYIDFVAYNKGSILLGTQRDLPKLSGRVAVGKINGIKLEYVSNYTNLIQYVGIVKDTIGGEEKFKLMEEFLWFLTSEESQEKTTEIGMVNVLKREYYSGGEFLNLERTLNGNLSVPNVFE